MIKLFGWEPYMMKNLATKRDEELRETRRFGIFQSLLNASNSLIPLLGKISVIALYVGVFMKKPLFKLSETLYLFLFRHLYPKET